VVVGATGIALLALLVYLLSKGGRAATSEGKASRAQAAIAAGEQSRDDAKTGGQ